MIQSHLSQKLRTKCLEEDKNLMDLLHNNRTLEKKLNTF